MPALSNEFEAYMLAHHYGAVRLNSNDRSINTSMVKVEINGKQFTLALDTGMTFTVLNAACAKRLKLDVHPVEKSWELLGGLDKGAVGIAPLASFTLGGLEINRLSTIRVFLDKDRLEDCDGLLGFDYLRLNAAVIPVGGSGILIKPGPLKPVDIGDYMRRLGFKAVPMDATGGCLKVVLQLNSRPFNLIVDSGAAFTLLDADVVRAALGHDLPSNYIETNDVASQSTKDFGFMPKTLELGDVALKPAMLTATHSKAFGADHYDGLLGYDFLGQHRAVIDLGDSILWIRP